MNSFQNASRDDVRPAKTKKRLRIGRLGKRSGSSDSWATVKPEETASNITGVGIEGAIFEAIRRFTQRE